MSYVPTIWKAHSMTPDEKLAGLSNFEQIYSSLKSYLDVYYHDTSYYLKAEAENKFFGSGNDGAGTGLVAETLDGFSSQQILDAGFPSGGICGWAGAEASIPAGFALTNGAGGTPNLLGRILVAAGGHYSRGDTGGANTVTTTATVTIAGHALTAAEIPLHGHGTITDYYEVRTEGYPELGYAGPLSAGPASYDRITGDTGGGGSHDHTASFAGTASQDKRPSFMALCLICKS